jgi:D-alanyl-D-alanine carboxypeptidase
VVRYLEGQTAVTGYQPEPWHLRYIGPQLARAYHDGGFLTLEEFFGLPGAPDYAG